VLIKSSSAYLRAAAAAVSFCDMAASNQFSPGTCISVILCPKVVCVKKEPLRALLARLTLSGSDFVPWLADDLLDPALDTSAPALAQHDLGHSGRRDIFKPCDFRRRRARFVQRPGDRTQLRLFAVGFLLRVHLGQRNTEFRDLCQQKNSENL
jgi:hypothetical protein